jgi:hypothetical protein
MLFGAYKMNYLAFEIIITSEKKSAGDGSGYGGDTAKDRFGLGKG